MLVLDLRIGTMYNLATLVIAVQGIMPKLTFRNSHGQLMDISTVAATKVKNEFGAILEQAIHTVERSPLPVTTRPRPCSSRWPSSNRW